jgi:hypothetical protein
LSVSIFLTRRKRKVVRLRPTKAEGLYLHYRLKSRGIFPSRLSDIARVQKSIVFDVLSGRRRSARVEAEIARILGKADWNEVVLESRSAVTGKSVKTLLEERENEETRQLEQFEKKVSAIRSLREASKRRAE